jgi:adenine-specific DNA glycosylase
MGSNFPETYKELLSQGVGDYTAAAIASFSQSSSCG